MTCIYLSSKKWFMKLSARPEDQKSTARSEAWDQIEQPETNATSMSNANIQLQLNEYK